jgi:DNA-binding transcriptional LysR family regulator
VGGVYMRPPFYLDKGRILGYTVPPMDHFDLNAAFIFVRVAQEGSFRGAARALGVPKTTISRKVAELEERLGVQLLQRTTRTQALTDAGAAFVEEAEGAFARLDAAEAAVKELQRAPSGKLRVTTTLHLGQSFLAPIVVEFLEAYPGVEVTLHLTDRAVDLVAERFDIALRAGALPDSTLMARLVVNGGYSVVASPEHLARHGTPRRPSELAGRPCLRFTKMGASARTVWPFGKGRRATEVAVSGRFVSDDFMCLRLAAERGLGIARLPHIIAAESIRSGRLVTLLDAYAPPSTPMHLVYVGGKHLPSRTRAFLEFAEPRLARALAEASVCSHTPPALPLTPTEPPSP